MAEYSAPMWDLEFVMRELARVDEVASYPDFEAFDAEMLELRLRPSRGPTCRPRRQDFRRIPIVRPA